MRSTLRTLFRRLACALRGCVIAPDRLRLFHVRARAYVAEGTCVRCGQWQWYAFQDGPHQPLRVEIP